jgi:hypothetical protein
MKSTLLAGLLALSCTLAAPAHAGQNDLSEASGAMSALPLAVVIAAPSVLLVGGTVLLVKSVEASGRGTVWVLERASDGAQASLEVTGKVAGAASTAVGTAVTASAIGAGVVLSAAGEVIAFIPNELGKALMYHEPVRR